MKTTLGRILKQKRIATGLSQRELSKRLGYESAQPVSNMERDVALPPGRKLKKLCRVLRIDKQFMFMALSEIKLAKLRRSLGI